MTRLSALWACLLLATNAPCLAAEPADEVATAAGALRRSVEFFRQQVSTQGGYLWRYSADLSLREGEGRAGKTTVWVQPPGTPSVGDALLTAYERTGDTYYRDAARETALALVRGQLQSGGWDYRIEFDPADRRRYAYRVDGPAADKRNVTTLDDNTTQAALRFLMRVDQALQFRDETIHEATEFALQSLLQAQYPNGAWPQRYSRFPTAEDYPARRASYPDSWSREYKKQDYRDYYTFNDNSIADMIATMFAAADTYRQPRYRAAAERAGDFILLAQMPDPQPAWAQQYDRQTQPAWARKFEPPAVTGGESQGVLRTLLFLYRQTGQKKFLAAVPRALAYLKASRLPDGQLARFYELHTNKPLFFTKDYQLTYRSDDMPTHYGFIVGSKLESIEREYTKLLGMEPAQLNKRPSPPTYRMSKSLTTRALQLAAQLDDRGAWAEPGALKEYAEATSVREIIDCRTFIANVDQLGRFLAAARQDARK